MAPYVFLLQDISASGSPCGPFTTSWRRPLGSREKNAELGEKELKVAVVQCFGCQLLSGEKKTQIHFSHVALILFSNILIA